MTRQARWVSPERTFNRGVLCPASRLLAREPLPPADALHPHASVPHDGTSVPITQQEACEWPLFSVPSLFLFIFDFHETEFNSRREEKNKTRGPFLNWKHLTHASCDLNVCVPAGAEVECGRGERREALPFACSAPVALQPGAAPRLAQTRQQTPEDAGRPPPGPPPLRLGSAAPARQQNQSRA